MKKFTLKLRKCVFFLFGLAFLLFSGFVVPEDNRVFIHQFLNKYYDKETPNVLVKSYELKVTNTGFCRYRRVYINGKEEFFAFNLQRFKSMDYYGNSEGGELWLHTRSDDVIVQTRNDREGAVDSMSTYMVVPLKKVDVEQLNELASRFRALTQGDLLVNK